MSTPLLSLIIPTHNRSNLLKRALESINSQMSRNIIEIIVVSDVKDIETNKLCDELLGPNDIYLRRNGAPGPSESRNLALKLAHGRYVMFLDDDDSWDSKFIENFLIHSKNKDFEVAYFDCIVIKERRLEKIPTQLGKIFLNQSDRLTKDVFVKNQVHMSCFIFSRWVLDGLKFDITMRAYEDWDFLLSVFERQKPIHIPITCSNVYEVDDETTDRRGSSENATNYHAVLDYLYVYRRHASPDTEIQTKRKQLLESVDLVLPMHLL